MENERRLTTYEAYGYRYSPNDWYWAGALFTVLVPSLDAGRALEYAKGWRIRGVGGSATYGCEDVVRVGPPTHGRNWRLRNRDRGGLGPLPMADDYSVWTLLDSRLDGAFIRCDRATRIHHRPGKVQLVRWDEMRENAPLHPFYAELLRRATQAALFCSVDNVPLMERPTKPECV